MTDRIRLQDIPDVAAVTRRPARFERDGVTLVGTLFVPSYLEGPLPAVVVTGAWTTVKEQMAGTYARELAARGFAALAFDFAGWGESGGTPRFREDPVRKTADVAAAFAWLAAHPDVDTARVAGLGICASAGYMASAAADLPTVGRLALVAPWLHDPQIVEQVYGGAESVAGMIAASRAAGDGAVVVAASTTDASAPMYGAPYYTEPDRGLIDAYDNRFDAGTWEPWLTYDALASADRLEVPTLVVGSDAMALPAGVRAYVERTSAPVTERWLDDVNQFDFYDRADVVTTAADAVAQHLR